MKLKFAAAPTRAAIFTAATVANRQCCALACSFQGAISVCLGDAGMRFCSCVFGRIIPKFIGLMPLYELLVGFVCKSVSLFAAALPTDEGPPLPCMKLRVTVCCEPSEYSSFHLFVLSCLSLSLFETLCLFFLQSGRVARCPRRSALLCLNTSERLIPHFLSVSLNTSRPLEKLEAYQVALVPFRSLHLRSRPFTLAFKPNWIEGSLSISSL